MFVRFLFAMFISSYLGTQLIIILGNVSNNKMLKNRMHEPAFETTLQTAFDRATPLLIAAANQHGLCESVLATLTTDLFANSLKVQQGANSYNGLRGDDRMTLQLFVDNQPACVYPHTTPGIIMQGAPDKWDNTRIRVQDEAGDVLGDSWTAHIQLVSADHPGIRLFASLHVLSPLTATFSDKSFQYSNLLVYIFLLNLCSALALVPLLVRRIRRAERVAKGWTQGDFTARIQDTRNDAFGSLTQSFNLLAASFMDVIKIKQELAAADERNRLARDLHDTAKQRAFAINLQLTALKSLAGRDMEESARITTLALASVHHLQSDLANVIKRMSASTIAEMGLKKALHQEFTTLLDGSGLQWSIRFQDTPDTVLLTVPHHTQQIFLIATEAAANVLRHAQATSLVLTLARTERHYVLSISDDGIGFDTANESSFGMGLANIRLRARSLPNGTLVINSHPETGTSIVVTFDL